MSRIKEWVRQFVWAYRWNRQHGWDSNMDEAGYGRRRSLRNAWRWMREGRHWRASV